MKRKRAEAKYESPQSPLRLKSFKNSGGKRVFIIDSDDEGEKENDEPEQSDDEQPRNDDESSNSAESSHRTKSNNGADSSNDEQASGSDEYEVLQDQPTRSTDIVDLCGLDD